MELIEVCLHFFDAVVRYGRVPNETVDTVIASICRAVNIEAVCEVYYILIFTVTFIHLLFVTDKLQDHEQFTR